MATNRNILKQWFVRGAKPLAAQFAAWIDSYWHKDDSIPAGKIEGLQAAMDEKASQQVMAGIADDLSAHKVDANAHTAIRAAIDNEAAARESGDADTLEAAIDAIGEHDVSETAHADIRDAVAENTALIQALQGVGGYLTAHDFGVAVPTQQAITDYALAEIGITEPLEIFNGTRVKNTFDTHVWILANTPDSEPPIFQWMDDGADTVDVPGSQVNDISADADDTVVTSGTLVNLLKSLSGRIRALFNRFHADTGHKHNGEDSPKVAYGDLTGAPDIPAAQVNADWNATEGVAQILNKPGSLPGIINQRDGSTLKLWAG
ncbi:MAG: hypothetical protein LBN98_03475, partial [Prevotellaceae bacterium]|nr:hypothetical protein [Prevotellaceae bacterium]